MNKKTNKKGDKKLSSEGPMHKSADEEDKIETHYTTIFNNYDYSDGRSSPMISDFRVKNFKVGDKVEVIVRSRNEKGKTK